MTEGYKPLRSSLSRFQPVRRDVEAEKRACWHDHGILVVAANDPRLGAGRNGRWCGIWHERCSARTRGRTMAWLCWLETDAARLVWLRAMGTPWKIIKMRFGIGRTKAWQTWVAALMTITVKLSNAT